MLARCKLQHHASSCSCIMQALAPCTLGPGWARPGARPGPSLDPVYFGTRNPKPKMHFCFCFSKIHGSSLKRTAPSSCAKWR